MDFSDKKRQYIGGFPSRANAVSLIAELREKAGGIQQSKVSDGDTTVHRFGKYEKVTSREEELLWPKQKLITVYYGSGFCGTSESVLRTQMNKYWQTEPATTIKKAKQYKTICLLSPLRALTDAEAAVLTEHLAGNGRVVVFACTSDSICNGILEAIGSDLRMAPITNAQYAATIHYNNTSTGTIPITLKGFIWADKDRSGAILTDPFGHGLIWNDIAVMTSGYGMSVDGPYSQQTLDWIGDGSFEWVRNTMVPTALYPDDWTTLTAVQGEAWLKSFTLPYVKASTEYLSGFTAYEYSSDLILCGWSPMWLEYNYDYYADARYFSKWLKNMAWASVQHNGQPFRQMFPYGWEAPGIPYVPPIQS